MNTRIVFLDAQVAQHPALLALLPTGVDAVVLDAGSDGLAQMGLHLVGRTGLTAIHIVSHGSPGRLSLGNTTVSSASLLSHGPALRAIGQSLAPDGDLLIYGCQVAAGREGRAFLAALAALTGAHVAASEHLTGATALGADAGLEVRVGNPSSVPLFSQAVHDRLGVSLGSLPATLLFNSGGWFQTDAFGDATLPDSIGSSTEVDKFEFVANTTGAYTFTVPAGTLDAQFRLYGPDGNPITATIDSFGPGGTETVTVNLVEGAWTQIAIAGFGSSIGAYTFKVLGPDAIAPELNPVAPTFAESWQAAVGNQGDIDFWRLTAPAGTNSLNVSVLPQGFDSSFSLFTEAGVFLQQVNNAGSGLTDSLSNLAVTPGTSLVLGVSSTTRFGTGDYTINLDYSPDQTTDFGDPPDTITPNTGTVMKLNPFGDVARNGMVSAAGELTTAFSLFQFHVETPGNHVISVDSAIDTQLRVYDSQGHPLTDIIDKLSAGGSETRSLDLGSTEWVYVAVGGFQNQTGPVTVRVDGPNYNSVEIPTPAAAFAGSNSGGIGTEGDVDYWSITAPSGTRALDLSVVPERTLDTVIELYDSRGLLLLTIDNPTFNFQGEGVTDSATDIAVVAGETYFVGVSSNSRTATGSYSLAVDFNPDVFDNTPPTVLSFSPADEATGVPVASPIVVTFSEPIQLGSGSIVLRDGAGATIETFSSASKAGAVSVFGNVLTLDPSADLFLGGSYRVDFATGSVKDLAGNHFAGTSTYNFSTQTTVSTVATPGDDVLTGTPGADTILALAGNDQVHAGDGNDIIDGGPGADHIDGGNGIDVAVFPLLRGDYLLSRDSHGVVTVADRFGTTDTLVNVETIRTASGDVATSSLSYLPGFTEAPTSATLVYRFYNDRDKAFFYTSSVGERDMIIRESTDPSFTPENGIWPYFYQGATYETGHSSAGALPVYRFYNFVTGHHFFTTSEAERENVFRESTDPSFGAPGLWTYNFEGEAFKAYSGPNHTDALEVFRFYSPSLDRHFFTGSAEEAAEIRLTGIWNDEGTGYYGELPG
jgi:hypothetical protein